MAKLTYANKAALNENPSIAAQNKITDDDINEIKTVVNENDDNVGDLTTLKTTTQTSVVDSINELVDGQVYSSTEVKTNKTWIDGKPIYRKVMNITSGMSTSFNVLHNIANVDYLEITNANIFSSSTNNSPIYYYSNTDYFRVFRNGDNISIRYGSSVSPVRIVIILEYTKTTD